jgi:hypothetical protein
MYLLINSSLHLEYDTGEVLACISFFSIAAPFLFPKPDLVLYEETIMVVYICVAVVIIVGITGFILGIVARRSRRKALRESPYIRLIKIAGILSVFGIILNITAVILGILVFFIPIFITVRSIIILGQSLRIKLF